MHPTFTLGSVAIPAYVAMIALGAVLGTLLAIRQAVRAGADWRRAVDVAAWGAIAGVLGSKVFSLLQSPDQLADISLTSFRATGQVWYGGLIAGVAVGMWRARRVGFPVYGALDLGAPALAAGHAVLRIGCLLTGDDYGFSTSGPWGVAFPHGSPPSTAGYLREHGDQIVASIPNEQIMAVHPVMVYDAIGQMMIAMFLWRRSHGAYRSWSNIAWFCVLHGAFRFVLEFYRPKADMLSIGVTVAQLISVAVVLTGAALLRWKRHEKPATIQEQAAVR